MDAFAACSRMDAFAFALFEFASKATHEGIIAARVIAGRQAAFDAATVPAIVFTGPEIAWCGLTEEAANAAGQ